MPDMMHAAFYESGTFWGAFAAIVSLFGIIVAAWVTYRVANPKRRLAVGMSSTALLTSTSSPTGVLEVLYNGTALTDPKVLNIALRNPSRGDISSAVFESGQPLEVDIGIPITGILSVNSAPATTRAPSYSASGNRLLIGPGLIKSGQRITFIVLTDGAPPHFEVNAALEGVDIIDAPSLAFSDLELFREMRKAHQADVAAILGILAFVALALTIWRG